MTVSVTNVLAAYARQAEETQAGGMEARSADPGKSFADLVGESLSSAVEAGRLTELFQLQSEAA